MNVTCLSNYLASFSRRSLVDKELQRLRDELSLTKEQYSSATKERLRLEKEINQLIDQDQEMTQSDQNTQMQRTLRSAYNELSDLSMLRLKSREFYCRMQVYIANHSIEAQTAGQAEEIPAIPEPQVPKTEQPAKQRVPAQSLKVSSESIKEKPKKANPKLQLNLNALKKSQEGSPFITVTPPVHKG